jgi:putative ABC transport system permease protein
MALAKLAFRNLQRNRRRTALTLSALVLGVGALIGVKGFIKGFQGTMIENQVNGNLGQLQLHRRGYLANVLSSPLALDLADTPEQRAAILSVPGVRALSPRIDFGAQLALPDKRSAPADGGALPEADKGTTSFLMVTAFDPGLDRQVTPAKWAWVANARGAIFDAPDSPRLVLNDDFAASLGIAPLAAGAPLPPEEQRAALLSADRDQALNGENVVVGGTFGSVTANDRRVGYLALATAQRLLRMEGRVTEYALALQPGADPEVVKAALQARLGPGIEVNTWQERVPFIRDLVATVESIFDLVSTMLLLVVLLGIVNAMLMSVLERVREIGTMLAVGMRRGAIVRLFVYEGLVLGVVGALLGALFGVLLVLWMGNAGILLPAPGAKVPSVLHPEIQPLFVLRVVLQAIAGTALASLWPAMRAARLRPVEALAHT